MFPWPLGWSFMLIVPGLALSILAVFGAVLALSIVAARFRDIQLIVSTVLQLVFLLTPIIWETKSLRGAARHLRRRFQSNLSSHRGRPTTVTGGGAHARLVAVFQHHGGRLPGGRVRVLCPLSASRGILGVTGEWCGSADTRQRRPRLSNLSLELALDQEAPCYKPRVGGRISSGPSASVTVVQALRNINLDLRPGDRLGLVGHNGAGKTTLLRVLAGIYHPTIGTIRCEGHRMPLTDIQVGQDDEATGYEMILMRGLLMGLKRSEIEAKVEEIAEFSELGDFLDLPIRTYSSGMALRLFFSIATSITADIILMDEWIAAGDEAFIKKANARLQVLVDQAHIIVIASHSRATLQRICTHGLLLEAGRIKLQRRAGRGAGRLRTCINVQLKGAVRTERLFTPRCAETRHAVLTSVIRSIVCDRKDWRIAVLSRGAGGLFIFRHREQIR